MINYKGLRIDNHYNVGFFGGWREGRLTVGGFPLTVCDGKEFVVGNAVLGPGGQGLTVLDIDRHEPMTLTAPDYRYMNDVLIEQFSRNKINPDYTDAYFDRYPDIYKESIQEAFDLWETAPHYPFKESRQSANISSGDLVNDLRDKERQFRLEYIHDSRYVNKNMFYQLADRSHLHPRKMTKKEFLLEIKNVNPIIKYKWELCDVSEIKRLKPHVILEVENGKTFSFFSEFNPDRYYLKFDNLVFKIRNNISAPMWDTVRLLKGEIYFEYFDGRPNHYCLNKVKEIHYCVGTYEQLNHIFNEEESYHYNNWVIDVTGNPPDYLNSPEFYKF